MRVIMVWAWVLGLVVSACAPVPEVRWVPSGSPPPVEVPVPAPVTGWGPVARAVVLESPSEADLDALVELVPRLRRVEIRGDSPRLAALAKLKDLEALTIVGARVVDMEAIGMLVSLRELGVEVLDDRAVVGAPRPPAFESLAPLRRLDRLERLKVVAPQMALGGLVESLPPLPGLSSLAVDAAGAWEIEDVGDLTALERVPRLETLEIAARRGLIRLDGVEETGLEKLALREMVTSLEPLTRGPAGLTSLVLDIYGGSPPEGEPLYRSTRERAGVDIAVLGELRRLSRLEVTNTVIADLSFVRALAPLDRLSVRGSTVSDLAALFGMNVCELDVSEVRMLNGGEASLVDVRRFLREVDRLVSTRVCPRRCQNHCEVAFVSRAEERARRDGR